MDWTSSDALITAALLTIAVGVLVWGWLRARAYGRMGLLAWLQSVVLMAPWFLFVALFVAGIGLDLIAVLILLVASAGAYIYLGGLLRAAGQDEVLRDRAAQRLQKQAEETAEAAAANETSEAAGVPPIPNEDLQAIRGIFGIDTFFATETIPYQEGAIFKGNLRGEPAASRDRLAQNLVAALGDKYRLFLVESPSGRPVVIVLPSSDDPKPAGPGYKLFAIGLMLGAILTSIEAFGLLIGFDFFQTPDRYRDALPLVAGLWATLGIHEIGHWLLARRHEVRLGWPYFIPSLQIGSFGAITRFESLLPSRSVLFDVALAGPVAGGLLSFGMLVVGFALSHEGSTFQVPTNFFQSSILVGAVAKVVLGSDLQETLVDLHWLAIVGWVGLTITALNLLPAGQLDGGRIVQAIYGRKLARRTTIATLAILGAVALFNPINPVPLYWAILVLFLQRNQERPSLDELTEPDDARALLGLLALFLTLIVLIPLSPSLAGQLGIGG